MSEIRNIVIVDDHTLFRKGLATLISAFPSYEVLFDACSGRDFIAQLNPKKLPDIVLLDISMPDMDGYATCEWIRAHHPSIKVLALSTMDADTAIIKMIKCGASGYVLKDADLAELKLAFSEVISVGFFYNDIVSRRLLRSIGELVDEQSERNAYKLLSENELLFLKLSCSEKTYQEIAAEMFKSEKTVDGYRAEVFRKLNVASRVGMVMYAIKNGIVQL